MRLLHICKQIHLFQLRWNQVCRRHSINVWWVQGGEEIQEWCYLGKTTINFCIHLTHLGFCVDFLLDSVLHRFYTHCPFNSQNNLCGRNYYHTYSTDEEAGWTEVQWVTQACTANGWSGFKCKQSGFRVQAFTHGSKHSILLLKVEQARLTWFL